MSPFRDAGLDARALFLFFRVSLDKVWSTPNTPYNQLLMRSQKGRILCLDDNSDSRDLVRMTLLAEGYDITCVESGREAIELVRQEHFDLLIFDNWMPNLTGTQVTKLIRQFNQTTPILFYSAAAYESDKQAAFDAGAQGYLVKPVGIDDLLPEVERLIAANGHLTS